MTNFHNNIIKTSAPASTMIMGEHAVLFGHTAIVCGVDQRIHCQLEPRTDQHVTIQSALQNISLDLADIINGKITIKELSFVLASIQLVAPHQGFDLTITSEFSHTVGLGSSASVTASCVYALLLYKYGQTTFDKVFNIGLQVIHQVQQRGSGSDLVASVYGGLQSYTINDQQKIIKPLLDNTQQANLPALNLYYSGYKTPTPTVLAMVAKQSQQFPNLYKNLYENMHAVSLEAQTAIYQNDWQAFGKLMNIYHGLMDALGVCDGTLAELIYTARQHDNVLGAKISGSGLGDCIITLNSDDAIINLCDIAPIQAKISEKGLIINDQAK